METYLIADTITREPLASVHTPEAFAAAELSKKMFPGRKVYVLRWDTMTAATQRETLISLIFNRAPSHV